MRTEPSGDIKSEAVGLYAQGSYEISEKWNVYYVEKSILQKTRDYMCRSVATPVTVTVDAAMPLLVIGGVSYDVVNSDGPTDVGTGEFMNSLLRIGYKLPLMCMETVRVLMGGQMSVTARLRMTT